MTNNRVEHSIPADAALDLVDAPVRAPWIIGRRLLRSLISYKQASDLGDAFARFAPQRVQRSCERQFDFPIPATVRGCPLLLIRIPKTASVSLSLQLYGRVSHVPHRKATFYRAADPRFFAEATSFAIVRDPWDRAWSAFKWLRGTGNALAAPDSRGRRSVRGLDSFERFVFGLLLPAFESGNLARLDPVLHCQADYVCDAADRLIVDHVFRFERISEVQAFLASRRVPGAERHVNASKGSNESVDAVLTPDLIAAIRTIYARDVSLFGYPARRDP